MKLGKFEFTGDPHDHNWREQAACLSEHPPDMLFDERVVSEQRMFIKYVCRKQDNECPVQAGCLVSAIRNGERAGVWGGLTKGELSKIAGNVGRRLLEVIDNEADNIRQININRNADPQSHAQLNNPYINLLNDPPQNTPQAS